MRLLDLSHEELVAHLAALGEPRFRADQLFRWLHHQGAESFAAMSNLAAGLRDRLAAADEIGLPTVDAVARSRDGTEKLRLRLADGLLVESVLIPARDEGEDEEGEDEGEKLTLCISSQAGCALGCAFCATAGLGLARNLTPGEIVGQVYRARARAGRRVSNLVYMGMGEPLANVDAVVTSLRLLTDARGADLSHRRVTVSTAGVVPGLRRLGEAGLGVGLAVSLNATSDEVRDRLMPINRRYPLAELLAAVRAFPRERRRRVTFEYVLLAGVNDTPADVRRLPELLAGIPCKVNLIPWNPHPGAPGELRRPAEEATLAFQASLKRAGLPVYLRTPRGQDIAAACGQLVAETHAPD